MIAFLIFVAGAPSIVLAQDVKNENQETIKSVSNKVEEHCISMKDDLEQIEKDKKRRQEQEKKRKEESEWTSIGSRRITTYCPACNDPAGSYQSSSGTTLYEGCAACSWLPLGTRVRVNGNEYLIVDRCGTDALDLFVDTSYCMCNTNYYATVYIHK